MRIASEARGRGGSRIGDLRFEIGGRFGRADDAVGDERGLAAGFVGVEAVVADGLVRDRRLGDRRQKT